MSMTPAEVERKVRQLDNDVQSIYELLATINGTLGRHSNRFDELGEDVAGLKVQLAGLDTRVAGLDTKLTGLDTRVAGLDTKLTGLDTRVAGLGTKLTGLDTRVASIETKLDTVVELLRSR